MNSKEGEEKPRRTKKIMGFLLKFTGNLPRAFSLSFFLLVLYYRWLFGACSWQCSMFLRPSTHYSMRFFYEVSVYLMCSPCTMLLESVVIHASDGSVSVIPVWIKAVVVGHAFVHTLLAVWFVCIQGGWYWYWYVMVSVCHQSLPGNSGFLPSVVIYPFFKDD